MVYETYPIEEAIDIHQSLAPWESKNSSYFKFLGVLGLCAVAGLVAGSLIDNFVEWGQGNTTNSPSRLSCLQWFAIQIATNITFLFIINHFSKFAFVPWLLMTLAGFIFLLTLVTVQNTLVDNSTCLFKFN